MGDWQRASLGALGWLMTRECPGLRAYQREVEDGHLSVLAGREPDHPGGPKWHLSISHRTNGNPPAPGRYPTWDEIHDARYRFIPNSVTVAIILPPQEEYVNLHEKCFHLWEIAPEEKPAMSTWI